MFDDGHHKFALAWWFMGMPEEVHAWIGRTEVAGGMVDGPAMVSFRFPGSRLGVFEAVHSRELQIDTAHYAQDDQVEITGSEGVLWVTRGHGRLGDRPPVILYRDGETTGFSAMPTGWEESFVARPATPSRRCATGGTPVLTGGAGAATCCASRWRPCARRKPGGRCGSTRSRAEIGRATTPLRARVHAIGPPRAFPCGPNSGLIRTGPHRGLDRASWPAASTR